jgi:hypothetical protein
MSNTTGPDTVTEADLHPHADDSLPDGADDGGEQHPLTVDEQRAQRLAVASPLDRAIQTRPFGNPRTARYQPALRMPISDQMTTPPLDMDPGLVTEMDGYADRSDIDSATGLPRVKAHPSVQQAAAAMNGMRTALIQIAEAREKSKRHPELESEASQVLAVQRYVDGMYLPPSERGDTARKALDYRISEVEKLIEATVLQGGSFHLSPQAIEVRGHVKGLSTEARMKFIDGLMEAGDHESLAAILRFKPYLSGLSQGMVDSLNEQYVQRTKPYLLAEVAMLNKVKDTLMRAHHWFINYGLERAAGVKRAVVADLRKRVAAAKF